MSGRVLKVNAQDLLVEGNLPQKGRGRQEDKGH
jgi:hypothetical protein